MTKTILQIIAASAAAILGLVWLGRYDQTAYPDRVGKAESWSASFPFAGQQAEVLETGLDDVRGLACDRGVNVFLAEDNGLVLRYRPNAPLLEPQPLPDEPGTIDQRGIAVGRYSLVVAQRGRGRVAVQGPPWGLPAAWAVNTDGGITGPSGIALSGNTLFISDDRPGPDTASGAVWECPVHDGHCTPALVGSHLRHPSGIALEKPGGRLFVAESDAQEVRWTVFEKPPNGYWNQAGALGSAPAAGKALPPFLGVAFDDSRKLVYAAGPNSLYVLSPEQGMLGRIVFEEPVTGVAWRNGTVYLVAGHRLCRLGARK